MQKITSLAFLISILIGSNLSADEAPMGYVHGGTVSPENNNDIQLVSEIIDISLFDTYYSVEVNYKFTNRGKEQEVVMGFPNILGYDSIVGFKAYENELELKSTRHLSKWDYKAPESCKTITSYFDSDFSFMCHSIFFKKNETKKIRNTYQQKYNEVYGEDVVLSFHYILKTGAFWKGEISSAEVKVHSENLPFYFNAEKACFNDEEISLNNFYRKYTNFEPDEDLAFKIYPKSGLVPIKASSTLAPSDSVNFDVSNLVDGNPVTAWIEGAEGAGADEKVVFHSFNNCQKLDSVGVVNGFAKSEQTFKEYNKVYCLEVEAWCEGPYIDFEELRGGPERVVYKYILDNTRGTQILRFKYPIIANYLSFKIISINHDGKLKYPNKTAISEIEIFTSVPELF